MKLLEPLFIALIIFAFAEARVLQDFNSLLSALVNGHQVRYVANYGLCQPSPGPAIGGDELEVFQFSYDPALGPAKLSFGNSKLITNYQGKGHVYDMVSATLQKAENDGNNATITFMASDVTSDSWEPVYEEYLNCSFQDKEGRGAVLFRTMSDVEPQLLEDFNTLRDHILMGYISRVVFVLENCNKYSGRLGDKPPKLLFAETLKTFEYFNASRFGSDEFFAFSADKIKKREAQGKASEGNYQYELEEVKVWKNNTVHVKSTGFSTLSQEVQFQEWFECSIARASDQNPQIKFYKS